MIHLACEAPKIWMEEVSKSTDFEYALAHLILQDSEYLAYFKRMLKNGKDVILDNSAFELLEPLEAEEVLRARDLIMEGNYDSKNHVRVIAPDILGNRELTVLKAAQFRSLGELRNCDVLVTLQGMSLEDRFQCYKDYRWNRFTEIAIPAGWNLVDGKPVSNTNEEERIKLIQRIEETERGLIRIHLLGCTKFDETLKRYREFKTVRSIDTSYPVLAAWENRDLKDDPAKSRVKMNEIFLHTCTENGSKDLIYKNILTFKEMINE